MKFSKQNFPKNVACRCESIESNIEHGIKNDECDISAENEITVTKSTNETTVKSNDQELTVVESKTEVTAEFKLVYRMSR